MLSMGNTSFWNWIQPAWGKLLVCVLKSYRELLKALWLLLLPFPLLSLRGDSLLAALSLAAKWASFSSASLALFLAKAASFTLLSASTRATTAALVIEIPEILAAAKSALAEFLSMTRWPE